MHEPCSLLTRSHAELYECIVYTRAHHIIPSTPEMFAHMVHSCGVPFSHPQFPFCLNLRRNLLQLLSLLSDSAMQRTHWLQFGTVLLCKPSQLIAIPKMRKELLPCSCILLEAAQNRRGDGRRRRFLYSSHLHAQMAGLNHYTHSIRVNNRLDGLRYLASQPLLDLQAPNHRRAITSWRNKTQETKESVFRPSMWWRADQLLVFTVDEPRKHVGDPRQFTQTDTTTVISPSMSKLTDNRGSSVKPYCSR